MTQPHFGALCLPCASPAHGHTTGQPLIPALGAESLGWTQPCTCSQLCRGHQFLCHFLVGELL